MAPISEYRGKYIKIVITVIVITVVFLIGFLFFRQDLIRCHLQPISKFSDYTGVDLDGDDSGSETTTVQEDEVYWNGLERVTHLANGYYSREEFGLSFASVGIISVFLLTVAATLAAISIALYFIIRSSQLKAGKALVLSCIAMMFILALGVFGIIKTWQAIRTESFEEPDSNYEELCAFAPIIYLYDPQGREVNVNLNIDGELTCTYPAYGNGWTVKASPEGTLTDANGREYEYLFWEAVLHMAPYTSRGFCVKGSDTAAFLEKALSDLGLSDTEADTFIMYWLPQMEENPYNVISFQTEAYENAAKLEVDPLPDTIVRVNMFFYASDEYVEIEKQDLTSMNPSLEEREGFVLVEWGGETV